MKNLYVKLLTAQKKIGAISKDSTNPFFKSKYFDINTLIEEVKPVMNECGLVVLQPLANINGIPALRTMIIDPESGELLETVTPLPENPDPQKFGSIITYFRRYALQSMLFLSAEDDDGNKASGPENVEKEWLSELQLNGMLSAIDQGKGELVKERMANYRMKKEYRDKLNEALSK